MKSFVCYHYNGRCVHCIYLYYVRYSHIIHTHTHTRHTSTQIQSTYGSGDMIGKKPNEANTGVRVPCIFERFLSFPFQ